jgi:serine/threonine protein kinase
MVYCADLAPAPDEQGVITERWPEVKQLLHQALQLLPEKRTRFVDDACFSDGELRAELRSLLRAETQAHAGILQSSLLLSDPDVRLDTGWRVAAQELVRFDEADSGTARFLVQEELGSGTFGVVYRVLDRQRNSAVALKRLRHFYPSNLLRFKHEFRSLVDLVHPNLVQMYELFGQDRQWFFTMELVPGVDFLRHARPGVVHGDWNRLRDSLHQLAAGVQTLHASERLHRDLKPSNVLVTPEGRVVILDFGLVKEFESQPDGHSSARAGTPAYMAPEQAGGGSVTEAADWYAVGAMLYEAITGQLPFHGSWREVMDQKQRESAPSSNELTPNVPADLEEACRHLLDRNPDQRARGAMILQTLQRQSAKAGGHQQDDFIGRQSELELLRCRYAALSSGKRQVVLLRGPSGMGKSSLLSHFLASLTRDHSDTVILNGRCRESESVPYKALDSIADELARYLRSLTEPVAQSLLPRHPGLLRRLFPVFGELEVLTGLPDRTIAGLDEQEIRRRAFDSLCEMLDRFTERNPLVISIDDLQWGDLDSIAFITRRLMAPDAPPVLLILSFRGDEADRSPALRALRESCEEMSAAHRWTDIHLSGLSEQDSRALLLRTRRAAMSEKMTTAILRESGGNPLLLSELQRFVSAEKVESPSGVLISDMIRWRARTLSSTARQILEALSVAGEPLSKATLYRILEAPDADPSHEICILLHDHLLRLTGSAQDGELETFHDQVRETSLSWLSPLDLRNWHSRLAETLRMEGNADPPRLLRHYRGAGNLPAAYAAALAAAKVSEDTLAFEQAARFYAEALDTGQADELGQASLYRKRAESLAKAGMGCAAAGCYREAARWPAANNPIEMQRLAAEQLMRSGHLDQGLGAFTALLHDAGLQMPETPLQSIFAMLAIRAFIQIRGLRWRADTDVSESARRRLDLLWSGALVLSVVNPIFGTWLQARHMLEALRAGDRRQLALSAGLGAAFEARGGSADYHRGRRLLDFAQRLASELDDPYISALMPAYESVVDYVCGRIGEGLEHSRKAVQMLHELRSAAPWERSTAKLFLVWFQAWGGRIREMSSLVREAVDDARSRGDIYSSVIIRTFAPAHLADLAADNPDRALEELAVAQSQWSRNRSEASHFGATVARTECDLYTGRVAEARGRVLTEWPALMRSLRFRKGQTIRIMLFYMRARTALATWYQHRDDGALPREVERYASLLEGTGSQWAAALGDALRGAVAAANGGKERAILLLGQAEDTLRRHDLLLLAAGVSRRRGDLEGESGRARMLAAEAFMRSENVLRPDRMAYMILPA